MLKIYNEIKIINKNKSIIYTGTEKSETRNKPLIKYGNLYTQYLELKKANKAQYTETGKFSTQFTKS